MSDERFMIQHKGAQDACGGTVSTGWSDHASADRFTLEERLRLSLPMGGEWKRVEGYGKCRTGH